jgi:hypothetical protein
VLPGAGEMLFPSHYSAVYVLKGLYPNIRWVCVLCVLPCFRARRRSPSPTTRVLRMRASGRCWAARVRARRLRHNPGLKLTHMCLRTLVYPGIATQSQPPTPRSSPCPPPPRFPSPPPPPPPPAAAYATESVAAPAPQAPRLFQVSDISGAVRVEEVDNFGQEDLIDEDCMLLDTYNQVGGLGGGCGMHCTGCLPCGHCAGLLSRCKAGGVPGLSRKVHSVVSLSILQVFVWVGSKATEREKNEAVAIAQKYISSALDGRDPDTPIVRVRWECAGCTFWTHSPLPFSSGWLFVVVWAGSRAATCFSGLGRAGRRPVCVVAPVHVRACV